MAKRIDWDASRRRRAVFENGFIKYYWDGWKIDSKPGSHKKRPDLADLDPGVLFISEFEDGPRTLEKQRLLGPEADKLFPDIAQELVISKIQVRCPKLPEKVRSALLAPMTKKLNRPASEKATTHAKIYGKFLQLVWLESIRYEPRKSLFVFNYCPRKDLKKWARKVLALDLDKPGT